MISTIQTVAKSLVIAAAMVAVLQAPPAGAARLFFAATGSGGLCTLSTPCTFVQAMTVANDGDELACADSSDNNGALINKSIVVDCNGTTGSIQQLTINGATITVVLRNMTMYHLGTPISVQAGTLILDNVHIFAGSGQAVGVEPTGPTAFVARNSLIDGGASAILFKPAAGGSINATLDHVTIAQNTGGGIKVDTTNGAVTLDITDSVVSDNGGNGINAVGSAGGQAIVNIKNSVIARNGGAGVQANGVNAGVLLQSTLLDQNAAGATSVVSGGNLFTYGNNSIVGLKGSGFTATATLQ
jgi:hypothetical protein